MTVKRINGNISIAESLKLLDRSNIMTTNFSSTT